MSQYNTIIGSHDITNEYECLKKTIFKYLNIFWQTKENKINHGNRISKIFLFYYNIITIIMDYYNIIYI